MAVAVNTRRMRYHLISKRVAEENLMKCLFIKLVGFRYLKGW